ncbi:glycosyltransferase family 2 protein [Flavobacterium sp. W21_SRS_FM6]|uniref:glycosyltransferase family 2 protein n=1 Tax=Flavobacterium sp. W21_SRS_FM6 TaxID=3240268 RepID=UPI003F92CBE7
MIKKCTNLINANTQYLISKLKIKKITDKKINKNKAEIRLFSIMKNECLRLPYFLQYYRALGVENFFILDNDSNDGTREYLLTQPDVNLFFTNESYIKQLNWRLFLLNKYGQGHWCVTVDADDIYVYAHYEQKNLRDVIGYLEQNNYNAMKALWVDIYSNKPISQTNYKIGTDFFDTCHYFDANCISESPNTRVFGWRTEFDKTPLIKYQKGMYIDKGFHRVNGKVNYAKTTSVVFHFNFFSDFIKKTTREATRDVYFNGGAKYKKYKEVLDIKSDLTLYYQNSIAYKNSQQLIELGIIKICKKYIKNKEL